MKFKIPKPKHFSYKECYRFLNRSDNECTHSVGDGKIQKWIEHENEPLLFQLEDGGHHIDVSLLLGNTKGAQNRIEVELNQWLDLDRDLDDFYAFAKCDDLLRPLAERYHGLRLIGLPNLLKRCAGR